MDERWEQPCTLGWHQFYSTPFVCVCVNFCLCSDQLWAWQQNLSLHQDACKLLYFSMACSYLCFAWIANPFTIPSSNPFSHWLKSHRRQGLAYISVFFLSSLSVSLSTFNSFVFLFFSHQPSLLFVDSCHFLYFLLSFPPFYSFLCFHSLLSLVAEWSWVTFSNSSAARKALGESPLFLEHPWCSPTNCDTKTKCKLAASV